jgi:hypothetical protein
MSARTALTTAPGPRAELAAVGAVALAPVFPLALTEPSLATTPDTGTPPAPRPAPDRSGLWLRNAAAGLCVLAAAAAAVSFTAQYRMAETARHLPAIAALEAAIPDAAALVFACLGIALALHGRRALRARTLNLASVAASVFMNAIAAEPGWRNLAIWALPPVAYALASDTLIGVVRARALALHHHLDTILAADAATPLAILGGLFLWLLRLALAPASTLAGFRAWVLEECSVAPGRRAPTLRLTPAPHPRKATKTARFLDLVTERHGPLASIPLHRVAGISADLAPQLDLNTGASRLASWATLCPGNYMSAKKSKGGRTGDGGAYIKPLLIQAAWAAVRVPGRLQARFRRLVRKFGGPKNKGAQKRAITAIAHTLLKIAYSVLKTGTPYADLGADFYTRRESPDARQDYLMRQLQKLNPGCVITITPTEAA